MSEKTDNVFDKKFGKLYLKRAKGNLCSSKILLNEKQYADSVFLLQQSIEKTLKGFALYTGVLESKDFQLLKKDSERNLKKRNKNDHPIGRGHSLFDIFKRIFKKSKLRLEKIKDNSKADPNFYTIMNMSSEEIDQRLSELETGLKKLHEIEETSSELKMSDEQIQRYVKEIGEITLGVDEFYTDSLPLIKHLDEIQNATEKCLRDIESYVSITELIT